MSNSVSQMLANSFSETFWELVGTGNFCLGCEANGVQDPEQGCPAYDDPFSPECPRHEQAEHFEEIIRDFAAILCKAVEN